MYMLVESFAIGELAPQRRQRMLSASRRVSAVRRAVQLTEGTMNKKFLLAWIVLFVAWFMGSFVVHGLLLHSDYMLLTNLFRPESDEQKYFPFMILAHVILSGAFVWIYARGVEAKPWLAQGVRFGVAVALLTIVPTYMIYFVVQPMPGAVVVKQIVCDGVLLVILGAIVAWLYRDTAKPRQVG